MTVVTASKKRKQKPQSKPASVKANPVGELRARLKMPRHRFAQLLAISERLLADIEHGKEPGIAVQRRVREVTRLFEELAELVEADFIGEWMLRSNEMLDGFTPLEAIVRGEIDRLWRMVHMMAWGIPV